MNRFSALSINENAGTSRDMTSSSESGSKGEGSGEGEGSREGEGSAGTIGMPSTPVEMADAARDTEMPFDPLPIPANQSSATTPVPSASSNNVSSTTHATVEDTKYVNRQLCQ